MMRFQRCSLGILGLGLAGLLACGGNSHPNDGASTATMNVHIVDGPISGYQEINLNIQTVEISGNGGWVTLGHPNKTLNLLSLVGGVDESLVSGATLPAGHYGQMRLVLGSGNTVKLSDGTTQDLKVPSGLQSGIKLVVSFDVAAGTTKDVWIDFDAAHSIQVVLAGASGQYILRPTIWAFDKLVTGSIHGILTDGVTSVGLPGVAVYAETLDGSGNPVLSRSTVTDATGAYTLDLLPVGGTYYVVSQPVAGSSLVKVYDAKASDAFNLTTGSPVFTYNAAFTWNASVGGITGAITPLATSSQSDQVNLMQTLTTPTSGSHAFLVQTTMATVGASTETYGFATVPAGAYSVQALRTTLNPDSTLSTLSSGSQAATVAAGVTTTTNLGF